MLARDGYERMYRAQFDAPSPGETVHGASRAPILSRATGFLRGFDLTMQIQVGCPGGCLYCYVPTNAWFTSHRARGPGGRLWGYRVFNKEQVIAQFRQNLVAGVLRDRTIYWSGVTDPYAAPPAVTRGLWDTLIESPPPLRPRRIVVQTRFRPDRDREWMAAHCASTAPSDGGPAVVVSFSVGTDRDDLIRAWEKSTPKHAQRLSAIENLRGAGITVIPTLSPFALWHDLAGTLHRFQSLEIPTITVLFFKQTPPTSRSATTPRRFLDYLRREYPMLLDETWQAERLDEMRSIYGPNRVIPGQAGFETLTRPHTIGMTDHLGCAR